MWVRACVRACSSRCSAGASRWGPPSTSCRWWRWSATSRPPPKTAGPCSSGKARPCPVHGHVHLSSVGLNEVTKGRACVYVCVRVNAAMGRWRPCSTSSATRCIRCSPGRSASTWQVGTHTHALTHMHTHSHACVLCCAGHQAQTDLRLLASGTRASVDFVETPSHLLEYFVWDHR
jgi:hypothetical protein